MGMKAKVGLLALLIATVAGAIAFDKFRAKTASTTDQVEPQKSDAPAAPEVAATPTGKGTGMTPVKEIVAAPKPKPEPPKPKPVAPPTPRIEPPKPAPPLPTDFTKAPSPQPMDTWKPVETVKDPAPKPTPPTERTPPVEVVNRTEQPKLNDADIVRPPDAGAPKPSVPSADPPAVSVPPAPSAPVVPDTYEVAPGDSLYVISQKVYGSHRHYKEIFEANRGQLQTPDDLAVGMKLKIPKIAAAAPPAPKAAEPAAPVAPPVELAGKRTHTVKPGDNLSTISKLYYKESRFWQKIQEANARFLKDPHNLKVGDVLVIPEIEPSPAPAAPTPSAPTPSETPAAPELGGKKIHVVGAGDSLSTISQKHFGTTKHWKAIFEANRGILETPDDLSVGMKLVIPEIAAPPAPAAGTPAAPKAPSIDPKFFELGTPYTVQEGDSLSSIAERLLGSPNEWGRIYELNKGITMKDEHSLSVGKVIVIPKRAEKPTPAPTKAPTPKVESPKAERPALEKASTPPTPKADGASSSKGSGLIDGMVDD